MKTKILYLSLFIILGGAMLIILSLRSKPSTVINTPAPTPYQNTRQEQPITEKIVPHVLYKKGSIAKQLEKLRNRQPLSTNDQRVRGVFVQQLGSKSGVLIRTDTFVISYTQPFDIFESEILIADISKAKRAASDWLISQGISIQGICNLPLLFNINKNIAVTLQASGVVFDPLPEECAE